MDPISSAVEKEAVGWLFSSVRKLWSWHTDVVAENKALKAKVETVTSQLDKKLDFERKKAGLIHRQEDDNIYRAPDGTLYCPLCLHQNELFIPLTNHFEGSYCCKIHNVVFETEARRLRGRQNAQSMPPTLPRGPHGWMGS